MDIVLTVIGIGITTGAGCTLFLLGRYCGYKEGLSYGMLRIREMFSEGLD